MIRIMSAGTEAMGVIGYRSVGAARAIQLLRLIATEFFSELWQFCKIRRVNVGCVLWVKWCADL